MKHYENLDDIFGMIDRMRERLIARVNELSAAQTGFRPAPEGWSIAEIIEHLALIEGGIVRMINGSLVRLEAAGGDDEKPTSVEAYRASSVTLAEHGAKAAVMKFQAPDHVRPEGAKPVAESIAALEATRRALHQLRPRLEKVTPFAASFPHPYFGALDLAQWLAFIGLHEGRHLRQIENVIAAPDFPAPANAMNATTQTIAP